MKRAYVELNDELFSHTLTGKGKTRRPWGTKIIGKDAKSGATLVVNEFGGKPCPDPRDPKKGGRKIMLTPVAPWVREMMAIVTAVRLKVPLSPRGRAILQSHLNQANEGASWHL